MRRIDYLSSLNIMIEGSKTILWQMNHFNDEIFILKDVYKK